MLGWIFWQCRCPLGKGADGTCPVPLSRGKRGAAQKEASQQTQNWGATSSRRFRTCGNPGRWNMPISGSAFFGWYSFRCIPVPTTSSRLFANFAWWICRENRSEIWKLRSVLRHHELASHMGRWVNSHSNVSPSFETHRSHIRLWLGAPSNFRATPNHLWGMLGRKNYHLSHRPKPLWSNGSTWSGWVRCATCA